jgi:DNA repair exonuclease SbcCD ATPase subunit
MLIHKITVDNFMAPGRAELELPESGITVLTGHNGAGKSRFIEAVAYAFFGETLREEDPWIEGVAGEVAVLSDIGDVARRVTKGGSKTLFWNGEKADTAGRTKERIKAATPAYDFWRRTHVFSSDQAAHFSSATDGERKRIMEMLLGMEVFDRAQREALDALSAANAAVSEAATEVAKAEGRVNVARAKEQALRTAYPAFVPSAAPVAPECDPLLLQKIERAKQDLGLAKEKRTDAVRASAQAVHTPAAAIGDQRRVLQAIEAKLELARAGQCSECEQPWHGASVEELEQEAGDAAWKLEALEQEDRELKDVITRKGAEATAEWRKLDERIRQLETQLAAWERQSAAQQAVAAQRQRWEEQEARRLADWERGSKEHAAKVARAHAELLTLADELEDLRLHQTELGAKAAELQVASALLGVKGLRGHVLGRALDGVEAVANYWLGQIAPGRALTVRAEGDAGKITIGLHGFGGGKYKAASAGERRRVDAPLLLALAEVAGHGSTRGTLFLDEVFDALDRDGRALVCQALAEIGQTQSVVVVTHQEDLARAIPAVQRFEVTYGQLKGI